MEERKKEGGAFFWLLGIGIKQALTFDFPRSKSSLKTHTNYGKMFAVQQTFATKTVQVNKVNKTTKASFVQDMKKVNTMRFCFLRLILSRQLPR